ncbi:MAG TPA: hypothetical protein PKB06_01185 [Actinotalea sp.]|nr:hypothetical protein [Actinotalea sp.]
MTPNPGNDPAWETTCVFIQGMSTMSSDEATALRAFFARGT